MGSDRKEERRRGEKPRDDQEGKEAKKQNETNFLRRVLSTNQQPK